MKKSIIEQIQANVPGYTTKAQAEEAFDAVMGAIQTVVRRDGEARVPGFGRFKLHNSAARTGRNPATGEAVEIPAKTTIKFKEAAQR